MVFHSYKLCIYYHKKLFRAHSDQRVEELRHALDETFKNFGVGYDNAIGEVDGDASDEVSQL